MWQSGASPRIVRFGVFEVDLTKAEVRKSGLRLRVQEQPFQVLAALLEQPGEVISREDLIGRLWPDGTVVDFDRGLNAAVTRLRQVLSDSAETPRYVETVARRGYRFVAPVDAAAGAVSKPQAEPVRSHPKRPARMWTAALIAAFALAGVTGWVLTRPDAAPDRALRAVPLTTYPGSERSPTFSPDGNQVAFQWDKGDGAPHIYIKLVGPGDPVPLTSGPAAEFGPAWSPDGSQIAFVRHLDEGTLGVFLIPALGGVERKLTEFVSPAYWWRRENLFGWLAWTHDSKHLIVSGAQNANGPLALYLVSIDSAERRRLTTPPSNVQHGDRSPAVSPDGRTVVFSRVAGIRNSDLYLMTLSKDLRPSGEASRLTTANLTVQSLAWMADGREIVFSSDQFGSGSLWRIGLDKSATPRRVPVGEEGHSPAVTKGGRLVYARSFLDSNIWRQELPPGGGKMSPASSLISSTAADMNPQYSPDGTRIAFQSRRSGDAEIWLCTSDGARCNQLTSFHGPIVGSPRWSPDGKRIAFDCAAAGNFEIYVVDTNGGSPQRLTVDRASDAIPSWSHDGKWIYFTSNRTGAFEIWKVLNGGGAAVQVTRNGGFVAFESADGAGLFYTKSDVGTKLWRSALDGSGETEIVDAVAQRGFAVKADRIYYLRPEPGGGTTLLVRFPNGKESLIASLPKQLSLGLSVSPDGNYVIYSQVDHQGSDLMVVEDFH